MEALVYFILACRAGGIVLARVRVLAANPPFSPLHSPHGFMVTAPLPKFSSRERSRRLRRQGLSQLKRSGLVTSTRPISSYQGVCESCLSRRSFRVSLKWTWGVQKQTMHIIFLVRTYDESCWIRPNKTFRPPSGTCNILFKQVLQNEQNKLQGLLLALTV